MVKRLGDGVVALRAGHADDVHDVREQGVCTRCPDFTADAGRGGVVVHEREGFTSETRASAATARERKRGLIIFAEVMVLPNISRSLRGSFALLVLCMQCVRCRVVLLFVHSKLTG